MWYKQHGLLLLTVALRDIMTISEVRKTPLDFLMVFNSLMYSGLLTVSFLASCHNNMNLEINDQNKTEKHINTWKLNMLLHNK